MILHGEESLYPGSPLSNGGSEANIRFFPDISVFAAHEFKKAADLYSQALEHNPLDPTLWCNRAYTRIKLEEHGYALSDASEAFPSSLDIRRVWSPMLIMVFFPWLAKAVSLDPKYVKVCPLDCAKVFGAHPSGTRHPRLTSGAYPP